MKASVRGVLVFSTAVGAQRKPAHAGIGPIVGDCADDREPRAAMGAVGKRITVPPVGGTQRLGHASFAACSVGNDAGFGGAGTALNNVKAGVKLGIAQRSAFDCVDPGQGRRIVAQAMEKFVERGGHAPGLDHDALGVVPHFASYAAVLCQPPNRRAEPDTLHQAAHPDGPALAPLARCERHMLRMRKYRIRSGMLTATAAATRTPIVMPNTRHPPIPPRAR